MTLTQPRSKTEEARGGPRLTKERYRGSIGLLSLASVLALLATSIFFSLPSNVLSIRQDGPVSSFISRLLPQGWGFFTKPPDSNELTPYLLQDGELTYASHFPNSASGNLFGVSREQRAQGPEMARLSSAAGDWVNCDEIAGDCRIHAAETLEPSVVRNDAPDPSLCGMVVIVETVPVPWVFKEDYNGWRLDSRATLVDVEC